MYACKNIYIYIYISLSMVVLDSRDQQGKLWLPQFLHLQKPH